MRNVDYLIVGQGLAGSMLAHFLQKNGKTFIIIDNHNSGDSSWVAAGLFNPITGRRFVKTWLADELFPFARATYLELESFLGQRFYFPRKIVRYLSDEAELREWVKKSKRQDYSHYMNAAIGEESPKEVEIKQGGHVALADLLDAFREYFSGNKLIINTALDYTDLQFTDEWVNWKSYYAEKIVFCEGYRAMGNPWFSHLPFTHAKGEILTIRAVELKQDFITSKGIFMLPLGNDLYRVGSTYDWDDLSHGPTEKGRVELTEQLEKLIDCNYEVVEHMAGIRPTVKDRRPLIGVHHENPRVAIFNGLGTKGVTLAPYFAQQFVSFLEGEGRIHPEADISRFLD
jgi:glycine/D-amino acid oxidase-like deaminating enzyme